MFLSTRAFLVGAAVFAVGDVLRRTVDGGLEGPVAISRAAHDHALVWQLGGTGMVLGSILMLSLVIATVRSVPGRGRWPLRVGGCLFAAGLFASVGHAVAYFGLMSVFGGAEGLSATQVRALDAASENQPFLLGFIAVFILGMLLGQLVWAVGLWRSGAAPVWLLPIVLVEAVAAGSGGVLAGVVGLAAWVGVGLIVGGSVGAGLSADDTELVGHDHGLDPVA
jgi:hypothetical protein